MDERRTGDGANAGEPIAPDPGPPTATLVEGGPIPGGGLRAPAPPLSTLPRGSAIGRYLVLDRLGAGGMGVVYLGYDPELDRRVALKLLRPEKIGSLGGEARLLREAQAIARLSHPHVVAVHDVGTVGGEVFVAMEHVAGRTLRAWLAEERRPWREVLAVFHQAGEGLAAAHAAGLAHRDFKPDNVLIGGDGAVKVVDFGLARALPPASLSPEAPASSRVDPVTGSAASAPPREEAEKAPEPGDDGGAGAAEAGGPAGTGSSRSRLSEPLTEWGVAAGTPAYMAPEQRRGLPADARSDQYSFCVALWEAVHGALPPAVRGAGAPPFWRAGGSPAPGGAETAPADEGAGGVRAGPHREVPGWLRQVLLRGMAEDPAARHPRMGELLEALARDPAARRRRWLLAGAALLASAALFAGLGSLAARRARLCAGGEEEIARVWNPDRRAALQSAFAATGLAYAAETAGLAAAALDRYAGEWARRYRSSCEATRLRGEQSEEGLDRRMLCLGQRRDEMEALVDVLSRPDAGTVEKAGKAVAALGDLSACTDSAALAGVVPLPHDAALRRRVAQAQARLARVKALRDAGRPREALALAGEVRGETEGIPYRPLQALASFRLADLRENTGDFAAAEEELYRALRLAEEGRDDLLKAEVWRKLAYTVGYRLARLPEGRRQIEQARASLARAGGNRDEEVTIADGEGAILLGAGRFEEAAAAYRRAVDVSRRGGAPDFVALSNLVSLAQMRGDLETALHDGREIVETARKSLGPGHPTVASVRYNLAGILSDAGFLEEADGEFRAALAVREKVLGREHVDVAESLTGLCSNWVRRGQPQRALPYVDRALAIYGRNPGEESLYTAAAHQCRGEALGVLGRYAEGERELAAAVAGFERTGGPGNPYPALPLLGLAELHLRRDAPAPALAVLDRALPLLASMQAFGEQRHLALFRRAQALWQQGGDRGAALALARSARDGLAAAGLAGRLDLAEADAWLAERAKEGRLEAGKKDG